MAILSAYPGRTSITLGAQCMATTMPADNLVEIPGGLHPLRMTIHELDEWRIMSGWPVPVPDHDIHSVSLVSADGEVISNRPSPLDITTGAIVRWVADEDYYDLTDLQWRPLVAGTDMIWETSSDFAPTLINDYEYRVDSERFIMDGINFDYRNSDHFWLDAVGTIPTSGYTVILVLSPNSVYGNDPDILFSGLWGFGGATPASPETFVETADAFFNVTLQGNHLYLETEQTARARSVGISRYLNGNAPMFLALTLARPQAYFYAASGPSNVTRASIPTGDATNPVDPRLVLGRSTGDVLHTANMTLFDVGVYPGPLTDNEVVTEIAILSSAYGGDT